jgi:hypothetical protein
MFKHQKTKWQTNGKTDEMGPRTRQMDTQSMKRKTKIHEKLLGEFIEISEMYTYKQGRTGHITRWEKSPNESTFDQFPKYIGLSLLGPE